MVKKKMVPKNSKKKAGAKQVSSKQSPKNLTKTKSRTKKLTRPAKRRPASKPRGKTAARSMRRSKARPQAKKRLSAPAKTPPAQKARATGKVIVPSRGREVPRDNARGRRNQFIETALVDRKGLSESAGQSGDIEGLSNVAEADSESVTELIEEGQAFEAEVVSGVEHADDTPEQEVTVDELSEDDIPPEYGGSE